MKKELDKMYLDDTLDNDIRIENLISQMTLEEKVERLLHNAPTNERLNLPEYNSWNECLHGVARAGIATVFPQTIGMAATFNEDLLFKTATVISDEARAKHHEFARRSDRGIYKGLTECCPNVNIFRDPRWGRGQETFGEDPYLTGQMGVAYIKGLQGDDEKYLKTATVVKHYCVHSGPENLRHSMDVNIGKKDLYETYLYAFCRCVKDGKSASVMGAYNRVNGEPCCASNTLISDILREEWGFNGYYQADYGAVDDIHTGHKLTKDAEESSVWALSEGCDLDCGWSYTSLVEAVQKGKISEKEIDRSLRRVLQVFFRLGIMDSNEVVPYASIPYEIIDCDEHRNMALKVARESMVLLKNENKMLPFDLKKLKRIAVIGPNADERKVLHANYNGKASKYITFLDGIRNIANDNGVEVVYAEGCDHSTILDSDTEGRADKGFAEALTAVENADVALVFLGLSPDIEGEETGMTQLIGRLKSIDSEVLEKNLPPDFMNLINSFSNGSSDDKINLDLPGKQQELLERIFHTGKPTVLILANGSPITINWAQDNVPAIIEAWYPGEEGGNALADILFGKYNPAGRMPVTFVDSTQSLPPFEEYGMTGRTYRYMDGNALYPFGFGLSYTDFGYSEIKFDKDKVETGENLSVELIIENRGEYDGDEVIQFYISHESQTMGTNPKWSLIDFKRIHIKAGQKRKVNFTITPRKMATIDENGSCTIKEEEIKIYIGGQQPDARSRELTGKNTYMEKIQIIGETKSLEF